MFRDQEEELQRLQAELLEQEEPEQQPEQEELLDEDALEELLQDTRPAEGAVIYQNFSNDYGKKLRNYANGYQVYNTDRTDLDPEELSKQLDPPKKNTGLLVLTGLLAAACLALAAYLLLQYRGLLG